MHNQKLKVPSCLFEKGDEKRAADINLGSIGTITDDCAINDCSLLLIYLNYIRYLHLCNRR